MADAPSLQPMVIIDQFGGAVARVPDDATAFGHRDAAYDLIIAAIWTDRHEQDTHIEWARSRSGTRCSPYSTGDVYVNYLSDEGDERVHAAYGHALPAPRRAQTHSTTHRTSSDTTRTSDRTPDLYAQGRRLHRRVRPTRKDRAAASCRRAPVARGGCTDAREPPKPLPLTLPGPTPTREECLAPGLMEALNPREDESHGSTEEVPGGAAGASDPDGGGGAARTRRRGPARAGGSVSSWGSTRRRCAAGSTQAEIDDGRRPGVTQRRTRRGSRSWSGRTASCAGRTRS